ncbi:pyruvoyl-dependent arginine decarboxylase [Streptoalloteichus hindustanus]|uniref:Pyruvoyl-dependent arginine decarboxylase AaxB n=1 Tax=Streptoalloteichus hindustanus TaxID=2017 RepID=A0A1M5FAB7_STRHI|nr:pyruvoyl-dependent arginine decarboxylase [Streptoalloteichus hindustanus]SHF88533.1 arginine decarboxylase [Streptoalloteichus hindustanus]
MNSTPLSGTALVPTRMYLTTGVGRHRFELQAHDLMYVDAGLGRVNRVQVSSRVPPGCALVSAEEGGRLLRDGQILFAIQALGETSTPGTRIATAVGVVVPASGGMGCVAEVHEDDAVGKDAAQARRKAARMALTAMAVELGQATDDVENLDHPERERHELGDTAVHVHTAAVAAVGPDNGDYVKILASLVFLF